MYFLRNLDLFMGPLLFGTQCITTVPGTYTGQVGSNNSYSDNNRDRWISDLAI